MVIHESLQYQERIMVDHIAKLLGGVEVDSQALEIKRMFYRLLPA
jgi:hypothetical protein